MTTGIVNDKKITVLWMTILMKKASYYLGKYVFFVSN